MKYIVWLFVLLICGVAHAQDDVVKQNCLTAFAKAQELRDDNQLSASRDQLLACHWLKIFQHYQARVCQLMDCLAAKV